MFGYVTADVSALSEEEAKRYRALYCGLCRTLGERHGKTARLALNYDLVFLLTILQSVYGGEENTAEAACTAHPLHKRMYITHAFTAYAADMNTALAYYNCLDDWEDEKSLSARSAAMLLQKELPAIEEAYPRQCGKMRQCIRELSEAEKANETDADIPSGIFGALMGELFRYKEDENGEKLYGFGFSLGKCVYLMDAYVDLKEDIKKQRYNPLVRFSRSEIEPVLHMQLAQCVRLFEMLPVTSDREIAENILYRGIWTKAEIMKAKGAKRRDGRSV